jgi:hypothetical protein
MRLRVRHHASALLPTRPDHPASGADGAAAGPPLGAPRICWELSTPHQPAGRAGAQQSCNGCKIRLDTRLRLGAGKQVLHDGKVAYPEAVEAVRALHEAGAKLIILSNSSRRAYPMEARS